MASGLYHHDEARQGFANGAFSLLQNNILILITDIRMGIFELLILLLIAGICGAIGQSIAGINRGGCVVSIVVGFIGALIGNWLSGYLGLPELFSIQVGGNSFPILWSIIGSVLFVALVGFITPKR